MCEDGDEDIIDGINLELELNKKFVKKESELKKNIKKLKDDISQNRINFDDKKKKLSSFDELDHEIKENQKEVDVLRDKTKEFFS